MSLVGIEDTSNSVLKNEDSIATSLLAVRRPSNKEKRKRKKKSAYRRKSFDTLSLGMLLLYVTIPVCRQGVRHVSIVELVQTDRHTDR